MLGERESVMVGMMREREDEMGNEKVWKRDEIQVRGVERAKRRSLEIGKQITFNTSYLLWNKGLSKAFCCSLVGFCVEYSMMNAVLMIMYYLPVQMVSYTGQRHNSHQQH